MPNFVAAGSGWAPVSIATQRHVATQVAGTRDHSGDGLQQSTAQIFVPYPGILHFATQHQRLGSTDLMLLTLSAMRVCGMQSLEPQERLDLVFVLGGAITVAPHDGDAVVFAPGGAFAISDWSSYSAESTNGTRCLNVLLPQNRLADRGVHVRTSRFNLEGPRSLRAPLRGFALALVDASWHASTMGELVAERTIEDLVVGMFLETDGYAMDSEDLRAGLRGRAVSSIAVNHRRQELNPHLVAEILSVSLRHLQRAFENSGDSVAHTIAHHRAESAALLLVSAGGTAFTMREIADSSGFNSVFELRAAFRGRYGMLPSEFRGNAAPKCN